MSVDALVLLKLGGSVLTDKRRPEALQTGVLTAVARTLSRLAQDHPNLRLVIGHGGGSFGHHWATHYGLQHGGTDARAMEGFARVQDAQGRLNRAVVATLLDAGINAVSVQPSAAAVAVGGQIDSWELSALHALLERGLTPVIYGDVVVDRERGAAILSTEQLLSFLALRLKPRQVVLIGEGGVWTADPRCDSAATLIHRIDGSNITAVLAGSGASYGTDVTGGMAAKVAAMWQLAQALPGLTIHFVAPGELAAVWESGGSVGTVMQAGR